VRRDRSATRLRRTSNPPPTVRASAHVASNTNSLCITKICRLVQLHARFRSAMFRHVCDQLPAHATFNFMRGLKLLMSQAPLLSGPIASCLITVPVPVAPLSFLSSSLYSVRAGPRSAFQSFFPFKSLSTLLAVQALTLLFRPFTINIPHLVIMKYFTSLMLAASVATAEMQVMPLAPAPAGAMTHTVSKRYARSLASI
jgi:hypothetical protein